MAKPSELIAKSEECARLARASDAPGVKYRYAIAAHEWREMAEEKRRGRKGPRSRGAAAKTEIGKFRTETT